MAQFKIAHGQTKNLPTTLEEGQVYVTYDNNGQNGKIFADVEIDGETVRVALEGKSAYQYAKEGGYTGTEQEFAQLLNGLDNEIEKHNQDELAHPDIREEISQLSSEKVNKTNITLEQHTDGLIYIFIDGQPVGNGVELGTIVEGDIIGTLDENNNILLSGNLANGTYTLKYENADGTYIDIGTLEVGEVEPDIPTIVNLATPDATATGQTAWESGGWCNNSYMAGSSYAYRAATDGKITTNTIAVDDEDTIYVKGITYNAGTFPQLAAFDENGGYLRHNYVSKMQDTNYYISQLTATEGEDYWCFTNHGSNGYTDTGTRFIRIAGVPSGDISDIIITRNQPIV